MERERIFRNLITINIRGKNKLGQEILWRDVQTQNAQTSHQGVTETADLSRSINK